MGFRADMRAAAVSLLEDYRTSAGLTRLSIYPGRPASVKPPHAFVDGFVETVDYSGPTLRRRTPAVLVTVVHGLFDSGEAVDHADAFVDGFLDYCTPRYHEAGANTTLGITRIDDEAAWVPDWLPPGKQATYYATHFTLEGLTLDGTSTLP